MTTKRELYRDAKAALAEASRGDNSIEATRKLVDRARWRAAEDMAELYELGDSHRTIADGLRIDKKTVSNYLRVMHDHGDARPRPEFGACLKEIRGGTWGHEHVSTAKRAEVAADYLKDREVWKAPEVKAAIKTNVRKDVREETRDQFKPANGAVTRIGPGDWRWLLAQMRNCEDAIKNGSRDVRQGGMPARHAGELIKQARRLAAAAAKLEELLSETAVGRPA